MTPKEKAEELLDKFNLPTGIMSVERKQCALVCVDEIIESWNTDLYVDCGASLYWQEVKQEIEKL